MKVVSNFHLNYPYEEFSMDKFVNAKYNNCVLLLDEAYVYLESRLSMSERNRATSYILFQSRKKNLNMYLTMQLRSTIDIRFRTLADAFISCQGLTRHGYKYTFINRNGLTSTIYLPLEKAYQFYAMYDTNEIVQIKDRNYFAFKTPEEQKKYINEIVENVKKDYPEITKYTKQFLKWYFFNQNIDNKVLDIVHSFLNNGITSGNKKKKKTTKKKKSTKNKKLVL
ncbi:MAG: hypothetical protein ACP6IY_20565 [Promethearchaeia archaeon]